MRFECRNGTSDKFWTFEIQDGNRVGFAYGRRGTAGQTMTKSYVGPDTLMADLERLVSEKLGKGYRPVENDGNPAKNIEVFGLRMQRSIMALATRERARTRATEVIALWLERALEVEPKAGPPAAPARGTLVAMKTKRRITFDD